MDNFNTVPSPAPMPEPAPAPVYTPPAPAPMPAPAPQQFQGGGKVNLFEGITFVDVGMLILATVGMSYVIYYYRSKLKELKQQDPAMIALQDDLKEVKMNVQNALGAKYKTAS